MSSKKKLLDHNVKTIQGQEINLSCFTNKVILVVNTASYCGYTQQYAKLELLYQRYQEKGLVILGFPCNDFGEQETGSNEEIAAFCEKKYNVTFPLMEKVSIVKNNGHPFFNMLALISEEMPEWNFHKYLIDRTANNVLSYDSSIEPDDIIFTHQIELLL